jgi:hypothetical protein
VDASTGSLDTPNRRHEPFWQEGQSREWSPWVGEPPGDRSAVVRERGADGGGMGGESTSIRSPRCQHDPDRDEHWMPPAIAHGDRRESAIPVDLSQQSADVHDLGLQLHDEQGRRSSVPGHDVDDAALAEDRERHLGHRDPPVEAAKPARHRLVHRGVPGVDDSLEVAAVPADRDVEARSEDARQPLQVSDSYALELAVLDSGDGSRGAAEAGRDVDLPQSLPDPEFSEVEADANGIHAEIVPGGRYLPVNGRFREPV